MKRLTVFVATMVLALLPLGAARAGPTVFALACGPDGDVVKPTGLTLVETGDASAVAAPVALAEDPVPARPGSDVDSTSDHAIVLVLGTVLVVLIITILI